MTLVKEIEALKVAPDEVLILRVKVEEADTEGNELFVPDLVEHLAEIGLGDRSLVLVTRPDEIEFVVAKK